MNRLLETERPVPLEFLINGQFLRTTIDDFLTQNGISAETTLSVEYVKALVPPVPVASYQHDDWVSSVDILSSTSKPWLWQKQSQPLSHARLLTASFDGALRIWNASGEVIATGIAHTGPAKSTKFLSADKVVSAGNDRTVRVWNYVDSQAADQGNVSLEPSLELLGHTSSVDNIAVHGPSNRILSASADRSIGIWSTQKSALPAAPESLVSSNKRRKLSHSTKPVPQRGPLHLMSGHSAQVSAVCFDERDHTVGYSGSWDHTVKTWDLTTATCVDTRTTPQSIFSVTHLPEVSLLAAGTSARHITMVDPRATATTISAMTLRAHSNAISSIATDPNSSYQIVSASYDGTCRIWDIRSVRSEATGRSADAVYVIERNQKGKTSGDGNKVFDVAWDGEMGIVSAGEDKRAQINKSG